MKMFQKYVYIALVLLLVGSAMFSACSTHSTNEIQVQTAEEDLEEMTTEVESLEAELETQVDREKLTAKLEPQVREKLTAKLETQVDREKLTAELETHAELKGAVAERKHLKEQLQEQQVLNTAILEVTSSPSGALVYVDNKRVGTTPLIDYVFNLGTAKTKQVKVLISLAGYISSEKLITLEENVMEKLVVTLDRIARASKNDDLASAPIETTKMILIPAGTFRMGSDQFVGEETKPIHTVYLNEYYIDEHEVTVGQYRKFVEKTGHRSPPWKAVAEVSPTDNHPMIGISWHDAMAYALWVGKRLPTEAEWEKAARGGHIGKNYPWGTDEINFSLAHFGNQLPLTQPVKSYPANAYGLYDMAGNVAERCLDPWDRTFYGRSPANNPFPGDLDVQETIDNYKIIQGKRVTRGGSYAHGKEVCEVGARLENDAKSIFTNIGFRCVKDVSP